MIKPEILAPAGSYDIFLAAIHAGADAVYVGGDKFGARAYANNFSQEELILAIDYAHSYDRKVYLTVNTLIKDSEIEDLYNYLLPFYQAGLDAVIVQDLGAFSLIRQCFPDLPIHASTQMTITNTTGAKLLSRYGATRIVPARELSLFEINDLKKESGLEIEVFVQGALCYCYSGQCLLSSMIGDRSGNRGRCAQPCRLPYDVYEDNKQINKGNEHYILSPKDMCTVDMVPELIKAGVDSFKIEGRMKNKEYVAAAVATYRNAVDLYFSNESPTKINVRNVNILKEIYNRGGFNKGYLQTHNDKNMMSMYRPNHEGVLVGYVDNIKENMIEFKAIESVNPMDVLEIRGSILTELTSNVMVNKGSMVSLKAKNLKAIKKGLPIYRTRNTRLLTVLGEKYAKMEVKENINILVTLTKGSLARMDIEYKGYHVFVEGDVVLQAENRPIQEADLIEKLSKLGNTRYQAEDIVIHMEEDAFLPMKSINELRRQAISILDQELMKSYRRDLSKVKAFTVIQKEAKIKESSSPAISVLLGNLHLLSMVLEFSEISRIYLDEAFFTEEDLDKAITQIKTSNAQVFLAMPHIFREKASHGLDWVKYLELVDGVLVRNVDELGFIQELNYSKEVVLDYSMYSYNNQAIYFYQTIFNKLSITLPVELRGEELSSLQLSSSEIIIYGYQQVMYSAQCVNKNVLSCDKKEKVFRLVDRKNASFSVKNICKYCYNIVYNSVPLSLLDKGLQVKKLGVNRVRIDLTMEDIYQGRQVINNGIDSFVYDKSSLGDSSETTRGHFKRGIE